MVGRKREFDREEALEKAMELFWAKGYNAVGLSELLQHMGIQRQSLYNTFGCKHALFLEAIQHYGKTTICRIEAQLNQPGSPLENLQRVLRKAAADAACPQYRGCFVVNAMIELAPHDPEVARIVRGLAQQIEQTIEGTLNRAIAAQELSAEIQTRPVASFLYHVILGFNVRGRLCPSQTCVDEILQMALTVLKSPS
ncbi:MAG: TetR/AcrR family transcriptional regulator [Oscillatoriales cyanobacterium RM2_1_1]|nr:TetR/AcrR family transcriptional regulator [Oscillatoriales cyanobacterium RM2_1_1]